MSKARTSSSSRVESTGEPLPGEEGGNRRRRRLPRALMIAGILLIALGGAGLRYAGVLAAVLPGITVRNGGMEAPYVDGIALPWLNNSYGDAAVSFSADGTNPHSGHAAQHIHCESVTDGAAQIRQLGITVRAGQVYTLSVWLRGSVDAPVFVGVRENPAPYRRYVVQSVRVSPQWHRYVITGTPSEEGTNAGIYIAFTVPGDLWIDDVELREGAPATTARAAAAIPVHKGNLLYNSGFELGADGWGPVGRLQIETQGALQGQASARCMAIGGPTLLESRPVVIRPGQRYTLSASLRASGPAVVELVAIEYADAGTDTPGQRDAIRQTFRIDRQWRRVALSGVLRAPLVNGYILQLNLRSGAQTVWADALQWEEGSLTPYHPAAPVEAAVRAPVQLFTPGQTPVTECRVYLSPKLRGAVPVTVQLEDGRGRRIAARTVRYRLEPTSHDPAGRVSLSDLQVRRLSWKLPRPGIYRVVATPSGTPVGRTGQAIFCCFPGPPPRTPAPRIGIQAWSNPNSPDKAIRAAAYLGAGEFRLHDFRSFVQWYEAEPSPGQFVWFDRDIADLTRRDYRLLGTLCRTPLWAAQEGGKYQDHGAWCSSPPRDPEAWSRYVAAVVQHYHGQIHEWEIWNEPWDAEFWSGTPEEYVQLLTAARRAIKAADQRARVVGGCFSPGASRFTEGVLQAGGLEAMDVVSYHQYMTPAMMGDRGSGGAPAFYQDAVELEQAIRQHGGRQPLWCTETGVPCPSFYSWLPAQGPLFSGQAAVAALVKGLTLAFAAGVERVYYYHVGGLDGGDGYLSHILNSGYTLLDYDGAPKPTLPALAEAVAMLGSTSEPTELSTSALRVYAFRRQGGYVAVVWARGGGAPRPAPLGRTRPETLEARDVMGASLSFPFTPGAQPVYLLGKTRAAIAQAVGAGTRSEAAAP